MLSSSYKSYNNYQSKCNYGGNIVITDIFQYVFLIRSLKLLLSIKKKLPLDVVTTLEGFCFVMMLILESPCTRINYKKCQMMKNLTSQVKRPDSDVATPNGSHRWLEGNIYKLVSQDSHLHTFIFHPSISNIHQFDQLLDCQFHLASDQSCD